MSEPIPMLLLCPHCDVMHVDRDEWATRPHKTHLCENCGLEWRPFGYATVGVRAHVGVTDVEKFMSSRATPLPQMRFAESNPSRRPIEFGRIELHTTKNEKLVDEFYQVRDDLTAAGSIVDIWMWDIAAVLKKHGYSLEIYKDGEPT